MFMHKESETKPEIKSMVSKRVILLHFLSNWVSNF